MSMNNFQRTATWLHACGKAPGVATLSTQIGCHIEEFIEFLECLKSDSARDDEAIWICADELRLLASSFKRGITQVRIDERLREQALDALCDCEVTGNGVAYLAGFNKTAADAAVLDSNDAKLVNGQPVILPGGKIGKPQGWKAPDLAPFTGALERAQ